MVSVPEWLPLPVTTAAALTASLIPWMRAITFQVNRSSVVTGVLTATATWDPGAVADGDVVTTTITVTGALVGDIVMAALTTLTTQSLTIHGHVQSANTVQVQLENNTGGSIDLDEGTLRVMVVQF